jgi:hypothetical protein
LAALRSLSAPPPAGPAARVPSLGCGNGQLRGQCARRNNGNRGGARCFSVSFAVSVTILTMLQVGDALLIGAASVTLVVLGATAFDRRDLR